MAVNFSQEIIFAKTSVPWIWVSTWTTSITETMPSVPPEIKLPPAMRPYLGVETFQDPPYLKGRGAGGIPNSIYVVFPIKGKMEPQMEFQGVGIFQVALGGRLPIALPLTFVKNPILRNKIEERSCFPDAQGWQKCSDQPKESWQLKQGPV